MGNDPELLQMIESLTKYIKTIIITVVCILKELSKDLEYIKKNQAELLEMENTLDRHNSLRVDTAEKRYFYLKT